MVPRLWGQSSLRPDEAAPQAGSTAQAGIPGAVRGQHERPGHRRPRARPGQYLPAPGHAADDVGRISVRIPALAERHPYAVRADRVFAAPHLYRRARLAEDRADMVSRLLD